MTEIFIYLPLGVVVGVLADLFGISGGIIFVLVLLLGLDLLDMNRDFWHIWPSEQALSTLYSLD